VKGDPVSADDYILVVEDDDDLRETLADLLLEEGYASCTASNGEEALAFLKEAPPPCLLVVDQLMPIMNGDQLLEALRTVPGLAAVPTCVLTADPRRAPDDVDAVIKKPIDVTDLLDVIHRHCRHRAGGTTSAPPL
jgi:CheY-like chemotaxis protein